MIGGDDENFTFWLKNFNHSQIDRQFNNDSKTIRILSLSIILFKINQKSFKI